MGGGKMAMGHAGSPDRLHWCSRLRVVLSCTCRWGVRIRALIEAHTRFMQSNAAIQDAIRT
eukprot:1484644-Alexandrium_andersonii.AAC.1